LVVRIGKMEGAGSYYGIPLDELHLEWTPEEELEIERYCQKILKNVAEEEMTPKERFYATMQGKPKDRLLIDCAFFPLYAIRTLDSFADALKPIDNYRYPKLLVKSHLATVARFKLDLFKIDVITYGEELWGGNAKLIEYGNPVVVGEFPVKSVADLEGLEPADPKKHGMYPQYLWFCQEIRRILAKYGLDKVMPLNISFCTGPETAATMTMVNMTQFLISVRKDPELCKRSMALCSELSIKFAKAIVEVAQPDIMFFCNLIGIVPTKGNEWMADEYAKIGKGVAPLGIPIYLGSALNGCLEWLPVLWERGALGPGSWWGLAVDGHVSDYKTLIDFAREHDLLTGTGILDTILVSGPVSLIEEEIKKRCDYAKPYPKCVGGLGGIDYWTPQAYLDAAVAAWKKYGKY